MMDDKSDKSALILAIVLPVYAGLLIDVVLAIVLYFVSGKRTYVHVYNQCIHACVYLIIVTIDSGIAKHFSAHV